MTDLHRFTDIHTHDPSAAGEDAVVNLRPGDSVPACGYFSAGIHPWDTSCVSEQDWLWLERTAAHERVVAIGEAGMDTLRGAPLPIQEEVFLRQVRLSERLGKPMIIHAVRTLPRLMQLRKALRPSQLWIIHGFRGKPQTARQLAALGFGISLGARFNPEVPSQVPPSLLFHETDGQPPTP